VIQYVLRGGYNKKSPGSLRSPGLFICLLSKASFARLQIKNQATTLELCIIPVTLEKTNLKDVQPGSKVNMEFDILAKYTEKLLQK
jgi:hypothetical protein